MNSENLYQRRRENKYRRSHCIVMDIQRWMARKYDLDKKEFRGYLKVQQDVLPRIVHFAEEIYGLPVKAGCYLYYSKYLSSYLGLYALPTRKVTKQLYLDLYPVTLYTLFSIATSYAMLAGMIGDLIRLSFESDKGICAEMKFKSRYYIRCVVSYN